jgi:hypothetical protein
VRTSRSRWSTSSRRSNSRPASAAVGKVSIPTPSAARATEIASMRSDLPRSRLERRVPAIKRVDTRTTRSPRPIRKRSSAPDTCRQSSSAHTRGPPRPRPHTSRAANPRAPTPTVLSPSTWPVASSTAAIVCERLWVSAPSTIMALSSRSHRQLDARRTGLAGGAATLLSSHADHPRPATSDTTKGGQAASGRQPQRESAHRPFGTISTASDVTDERIQTASLNAEAPAHTTSATASRARQAPRWPSADGRSRGCRAQVLAWTHAWTAGSTAVAASSIC